jgi:hypothetical protein
LPFINLSGNTALDARAKLAALLLLTGPELGHVITRLEQACPAALEILDSMVATASHNSSNARPGTAIPGKMEIVLDLVDAVLLKELTEYTTGDGDSQTGTSRGGSGSGKQQRKWRQKSVDCC